MLLFVAAQILLPVVSAVAQVPTMAPARPAASAGANAATAATVANPAMWKVQGAHGTIYLFGSVHVMKKDVNWETPKVTAAFEASSLLYTEVADVGEDAVKQMQPLILKLGTDPEHPLSTKISKEDVAMLDAAMKQMGAPGASAVEPMQPWLVYLTLSVLPSIQAGYDPASGIDRVLQEQAKRAGKPVKGFETSEEQMHFIADFPMPQQAALLHETLVDLPKSVALTNEMVADWEHGDVEDCRA